jgi:hypothetical protein
MEKRTIVSLFAAASFILSLTALGFARDLHSPPSNDGTQESGDTDLRSGGGSEESIFITGDFLSNNAANPDIDSFLIKCKGRTTICADVNPFGFFNDNTVHVSVLCISPAKRRGFGELEYGIDGAVSDSACVTDCIEAVVSFQCEYHDNCDENYDTVLNCVGKDINPKYPQRKE